MDLLEAYKRNPCGTLSIPYWKNKQIQIPPNMCIVHDSDFTIDRYPEYHNEPYFRLFHPLVDIPTTILDNVSIITAKQDDIPIFVDIINRSYTDLSITLDQLNRYTQTEVYLPELWIIAVDNTTSCVVGCGIADFDKELQEGIIEWVQVLPTYRNQKIGQHIVNELLTRLSRIAKYATVSGKVNNPTTPEMLYRKCGFTGNDVWHILTKQNNCL